jgi:uncharacterized membrane protein
MTTANTAKSRIASLDIIRGLVMVLMAIDHVRVYSGVPPGGPTPGVFFTRWVTNFCAPAFVFLAGTAAYLHGQKLGSRGALARFLVVRGVWLVLLELTVIRVSWTFNLDFQHYLLAGVIWMLGWCMILLAGLLYLPFPAIVGLGAVIVAGHNLLDGRLQPDALQASPLSWLWQLLYVGGPISLGAGGPPLVVLYVLVPWVGVMALGYGFGAVMRWDEPRRRRVCLWLGGVAVGLFLLLRATNLYGDPRPWGGGTLPPALAFLNTTKYPASLLFLLMTLGPMLLAIPLLEHTLGWVGDRLSVFGRTPLFFYLLHIPLIHLLALGVAMVRTPDAVWWLFANHPMAMPPAPDGYRWSLPLLYLVFAAAVVLLYFPCRWLAARKVSGSNRWLSYL